MVGISRGDVAIIAIGMLDAGSWMGFLFYPLVCGAICGVFVASGCVSCEKRDDVSFYRAYIALQMIVVVDQQQGRNAFGRKGHSG